VADCDRVFGWWVGLRDIGRISDWGGAISVALYSLISMPSQIWLHWKINDSMQRAYIHFNTTLSSDKLIFVASSMNCRMDAEAALAYGIPRGVAAAVLVLVVSSFFMVKGKYPTSAEEFEKYARTTRLFHPFVYLASAVYFILFIDVFTRADTHGLFPYLDAVYGVTVAGIIGASLQVTCTSRRKNYQFKNPCIEKTYLTLAQSSGMQFFHTTVWAFMTMLVTFGAFAVVQGFLRISPEISTSTEYGATMGCWVLLTLIPVLGAGLGIVMPALNRVALMEDRVAELDFKNPLDKAQMTPKQKC